MRFTLLLLLPLAWLVVIRVLCARATVSGATVLRYLAFGILLGPIAVIPSLRLFDPYTTLGDSPWTGLVYVAISMAVLTLPVLVLLFRRGAGRVISVADAFLLAFAVGFGFDLVGWLARAGAGAEPLLTRDIIPPAIRQFDFASHTWTIASTGYRTGLVALVIAAWNRFVRLRPVGLVLGAILLLVLSLESLVIQTGGQVAPQLLKLAGVVSKATLYGAVTTWGALLLLVVLQWREAAWAVPGAPAIRFAGEWRQLAKAVLDRRPDVYRALRASFAHRRQAELARRELAREPSPALTRLAERLEALARRDRADEPSPASPAARVAGIPAWVRGVVLTAALWWLALSLLHSEARALTTLSLAISAALVWLFVTAPDRPPPRPDPDHLLRYRGESAILVAGLAAALMATFGAAPAELYLGVPASQQLGAGLALVVLAAAGATLTLGSRRAWRAAPAPARRNALLGKGLTAATAVILVWLSLRFYTKGLASLHTNYGEVFFRMSQPPEQRPEGTLIPWWATFAAFGRRPPNGNVVPAWIMAWATLLLGIAAALGLRTMSRAVQRSYRVEEPRE